VGALLLLLLDSRSPSGGHNHSMGMESAVGAGFVRAQDEVAEFCAGRLRTSGRVAAAFAAAACAAAGDPVALDRLDAEFAARTPSEAMRAASEQLARGLRRLARAMLPDLAVADPARAPRQHPVLLGAPVTVPASAAVRLLGLDPFAVQAMLADLAREIDHLVLDAAGEPADLPADTAPALDLLADHHLTTEVRLFAS
jgi:urease accessory protein